MNAKFSVSLLVLHVLVISILSSPTFAYDEKYLGNYTLFISNEFVHQQLTLQCHSDSYDPAAVTIKDGFSFTWYYEITLVKNTLIYCDMGVGNFKGRFIVFHMDTDQEICEANGKVCHWRVDENGIWLYDRVADGYIFRWRWSTVTETWAKHSSSLDDVYIAVRYTAKNGRHGPYGPLQDKQLSECESSDEEIADN